MKHLVYLCCTLDVLGRLASGVVVDQAAPLAAPSSIWVMGYYPGWEQDRLPSDKNRINTILTAYGEDV